MKKKKQFNWATVAVSTIVAATLAVPASLWVIPMVVRVQMLANIESADRKKREDGFKYVLINGRDDPALVEEAISRFDWLSYDDHQRKMSLMFLTQFGSKNPPVVAAAIKDLSVKDDRIFKELFEALDSIGFWEQPTIPDKAWLRWINILATDSDYLARQYAADLLSQMVHAVDDPRLAASLDPLTEDKNPDVRAVVLDACARLAGTGENPTAYGLLISKMVKDENQEIARRAWLYLGLLNPGRFDPPSGFIAKWRDKPDAIASIILWAAVNTNPQSPEPAIEALADQTVAPSVRAMAAYALGLSKTPKARKALIKLIDTAPAQVTTENALIYWRAILAIPIDPKDLKDPAMDALARFLGRCRAKQLDSTDANNAIEALILSATSRYPRLINDQRVLDGGSDIYLAADFPMMELAWLEGSPDASLKAIKVANSGSELLNILAVMKAQTPSPEQLLSALDSRSPTLRDLACLVAVQRFSKKQNEALVKQLLISHNKGAKQSGAMLAGLTDVRPTAEFKVTSNTTSKVDLLVHVDRFADSKLRPLTRTALRLQDRLNDTDDGLFRFEMMAMLSQPDQAPGTSLTMATLALKDPMAFDYLLDPMDWQRQFKIDLPKPVTLVELLGEFRWWYVLRHYLPKGAPSFWVWADSDLQEFQVDRLRAWYVINRNQLRNAAGLGQGIDSVPTKSERRQDEARKKRNALQQESQK
jgi:HEAT repeat protein